MRICHRLLATLLLWTVVACDDDPSCADEIRIAASVAVSAPEGVVVDDVTIEKKYEDTCGTVSSRVDGTVYQCWEQGGGGTYVVRVYSGDRVWSASADIESASCHVKERVELTFDLSQDP
jgi:hypothetical protein